MMSDPDRGDCARADPERGERRPMGYYEKYDAQMVGCAETSSVAVRNREIVPNLRAQRQELEARIHKIDKLLQLLERNPEFIQMMDLTRELI